MNRNAWAKLATGLSVFAAAWLVYGAIAGNSLAAANCTSNDIIKCGVTSQAQLASKYAEGDVGAILDHYGITSGMVSAENAVLGAVTIDGDVIYDGQVIATGAESTGREWVDGSTEVKIGSSTVYQRPTSAIFKQHDLPAYIFSDDSGEFVAAVLLVCGNPVVATPKSKPAPKPVEQVLVCDTTTGKVTKLDKTDVTSDTNVVDKAEDCQKTEYVWVCDTDTWTATKVDKAEVTSEQKIVESAKDCAQVWVCDTDTGVATKVAKFDLQADDKVVSSAKDCKKPTVWVLVCDTSNWQVTKVDETKVQSGQKIVDSAEECSKPDEPQACTITCKPNVVVNQTQSQKTVVYQAVAPQPISAHTPTVKLPDTGGSEQIVQNGVGLASLTGSGFAYFMSRRRL